MNQHFSKIWIVVILGILIIGGIFAWQYLGVPKEEVKAPEAKIEEIVPEDETANWKTYRNEDYGFEIKYPNNWKINYSTSSYVWFDVDVNGSSLGNRVEIEVFPSLTNLPGNKKGLTLQEWINERKTAYLVGYQKEVQIGEYKGVEIQEIGIITWRSIFLTQNNIIYNFRIREEHPQMSIFNQMLSTFRFIE